MLLLLLIIFIIYLQHNETFRNANPCADHLSDKEYLQHMIPHHQVAIDISLIVQKQTKDPTMQELLRKIIWVQTMEIQLMKEVYKYLPDNLTDTKVKQNIKYITPPVEAYYPNKSSVKNVKCAHHFFDSTMHMKQIAHKKITDKYFLEHMIPHHQIAVDMSKKLLKHTKSDFMIGLCYRIIQSQQEEIFKMKSMLDAFSTWKYNSLLL